MWEAEEDMRLLSDALQDKSGEFDCGLICVVMLQIRFQTAGVVRGSARVLGHRSGGRVQEPGAGELSAGQFVAAGSGMWEAEEDMRLLSAALQDKRGELRRLSMCVVVLQNRLGCWATSQVAGF
jgi:hypothetical protein